MPKYTHGHLRTEKKKIAFLTGQEDSRPFGRHINRNCKNATIVQAYDAVTSQHWNGVLNL